ncbi:MAG: hypothetical protein ACLFTH_00265 [Candidatus Woesearchaeota archaeon]
MERFDSNIWTLREYLETYDGIMHIPRFKGIGHYELLVKNGYLLPDYSILRIDDETGMWGYYGILEDFNLFGLDDSYSPGKEGVHNYRQMLDNTIFETSKINMDLYCVIDQKR